MDFSYPDAGANSAALVGDLDDTVLKQFQFLGTTRSWIEHDFNLHQFLISGL